MTKRIISIVFLLSVLCFSCFMGSSGAMAATYTDTNHWAKNSIDYVADKGWFTGTTSTTFTPEGEMTRGMFVTVLSRYAEADTSSSSASDFSDVSSAQYYASAVSWARDNGIVFGTTDTTFSPDAKINREEASTILSRYFVDAGKTFDVKNNLSIYKDESLISDWAYDGVYELQKYGLLIGDSNNNFNPTSGFKRAEAAAVFARLDGQFLENYQVVVAEKPSAPTEEPTGPTGTLIGQYKSTFYCPGSCCNGSWSGQTALGVPPTVGRTIAVDPSRIKLGTYVYLEFKDARLAQYNGEYRAEDTGGAIKGSRIDVLLGSHSACNAAGVGSVNVYVQ